jgi:hypothetical protein
MCGSTETTARATDDFPSGVATTLDGAIGAACYVDFVALYIIATESAVSCVGRSGWPVPMLPRPL